MPCCIGKKFPAAVATVKCPSDRNNCGNSYNCLIFNGRISLYTVTQCTKTKEIVQWNPFLSCCVSFCLLDKILLVSRIQTAFARRKRSGNMRLGKMDLQHSVLNCCEERFSARIQSKKPCSRRGRFWCCTFSHFACSSKEKSVRWYPYKRRSRSFGNRQRRISNCNN